MENQIYGNQEPINLEEIFKENIGTTLESSEKVITELQRKFLNSCSDNNDEFKKATLIECNYFVGSQNATPYISMRYKLNERDTYYEDNFYLSENAYSHNLERLQQVTYVLGGMLTMEKCYDENTLKNYLNTFKGKEVMIQQYRNRSGHKLYNISSVQGAI